MEKIPLEPNDRYALVGKTGSGKTSFATVLAATLIPTYEGDWQAWWIDTKGDDKDLLRLKQWQFIHINSYKRDVPKKIQRHNRIYFPLRERDGGPSIVVQAQQVIRDAMRRKKVLLIIDEYTHVIVNQRNPGRNLGNCFRTGRGIGVGLIGCTQEPVYVPRQLLSQAGHSFLFDLHYPPDIKYIRGVFEDYDRPEHPHGFFTSHLDGRTGWRYYPDQRSWYDEVLPVVTPATQQSK